MSINCNKCGKDITSEDRMESEVSTSDNQARFTWHHCGACYKKIQDFANNPDIEEKTLTPLNAPENV